MSVTIKVDGAQGTQPNNNNGGGQGGDQVEGFQKRLDDIKGKLNDGDPSNDAEAKKDLKGLKKDVDKAAKDEEAKGQGADQGKMDKLMEILKMIMEMLQQMQGEGGQGQGQGNPGPAGAGAK